MTPSEFKAWFDGFGEGVTGLPTEAQWARIKARVAEIDGRPVTEHVYLHRYYGPNYLGPPWYNYCTTNTVGVGGGTITLTAGGTTNGLPASNTAAAFDSHAAMAALGRAESVQ